MRLRLLSLPLLLGLAWVPDACGEAPSSELLSPVQLKAGGSPIDVHIGHAAPTVEDFDGDGVWDLLVGQFGDGKLRFYKNVGTAAEPRFDGSTFVQAGGTDCSVPSG